MLISVVITAYNREHCIERCILSAIEFLNSIGSGEIIVVDDNSNDATVHQVKKIISNFNSINIVISLVQHVRNLGVCSAKNTGAANAANPWILFLDSDDLLIAESASKVLDCLRKYKHSLIHFFRCVNFQFQECSSETTSSINLTLNQFILYGTKGECLPVIHSSVFTRYTYDSSLIGFEQLLYTRVLLSSPKSIVIHNVIARVYDDKGCDRLSSASPVKRSLRMLPAYAKYLKLVGFSAGILPFCSILLKIVFHFLRLCFYSFRL